MENTISGFNFVLLKFCRFGETGTCTIMCFSKFLVLFSRKMASLENTGTVLLFVTCAICCCNFNLDPNFHFKIINSNITPKPQLSKFVTLCMYQGTEVYVKIFMHQLTAVIVAQILQEKVLDHCNIIVKVQACIQH